ncbi:hypothetical protein [Novipirellula rosea]|uniref:Uncharacterized protein n=1 Tax=Novipirellula rosea TaxID=1031540 RepID=A0ABP8NTS5_9BACT|tara:strand:- start:1186 stop:1569 length:384 start_codon:yes stop_codon:yes gene_type:complete
MFRLIFILAVTLWVSSTGEVQAQNYRSHSHSHRWQPQTTSSRWGISAGQSSSRYRGDISNPYGYPFYGYGYVYDPYQTGSFRAPDLLDDPYFNAQHKFDSHFPGRYSRRPPLEFRHPIQDPRYRSQR